MSRPNECDVRDVGSLREEIETCGASDVENYLNSPVVVLFPPVVDPAGSSLSGECVEFMVASNWTDQDS